jgi:hypothetical protein
MPSFEHPRAEIKAGGEGEFKNLSDFRDAEGAKLVALDKSIVNPLIGRLSQQQASDARKTQVVDLCNRGHIGEGEKLQGRLHDFRRAY